MDLFGLNARCSCCGNPAGLTGPRFKQLGPICKSCYKKLEKKCRAQRSFLGQMFAPPEWGAINKLTLWQAQRIIRDYPLVPLHNPIPVDPVKAATSQFSSQKDISSDKELSLTPIQPTNIVMTAGELCYYQQAASVCSSKEVVVGSTGRGAGFSTRMGKHSRVYTSMSERRTLREQVVECTPGSLCITNKRIIFVAAQKGFSHKIETLSAVLPYSDGITLQFESKSHTLLTAQPVLIGKLLSSILSSL